MNTITIKGNLCADPELFKDGEVVRINVASNRKIKETEYTTYFNCVGFSYTATDIINLQLKKGDKVLLRGEMRGRVYEKDGKNIHATDCIINDIAKCAKITKQTSLDDEMFI